MKNFEISSKFSPSEDQARAVANIVASVRSGNKYQTLLGVTGSGKTFTMANVIRELNMPTLIMTHNKSLA
ncbi:DEAD/DEAH box helicase family protein, partial [uncultured Campylobacter sp.]